MPYPVMAVIQALQEKYKQEQARKDQSSNNVANALQTVATGYYNRKQKENELQDKIKAAEAEAYLSGKGSYYKAIPVPKLTGEMVAEETGQTYNGMPVASPTPEIAQESMVTKYSPTVNEIFRGEAGNFVPQNSTGDYWVGKDKKTYVVKNGELVAGAPQPGWTAHNLNEESVFGGLQDKRIKIGMVNSFNSYGAVSIEKKGLNVLNTIEKQAMSDNEMAHKALATTLARGVGKEVGALTEGDKLPFGGSVAWDARMVQAIKMAATGKLTEENRRIILDLVKLTREQSIQNIDNSARDFAQQYSSAYKDATPDEIYTMLRGENHLAPDSMPNEFGNGIAKGSQDPNNLKPGDSFMGGTFIGWEE